MIEDDVIGEDGEGTPAQGVPPESVDKQESVAPPLVEAVSCLSCGAALGSIFCPNCGQKNDDLRRSSFLLARDFLKDTFGFDSRMWRTLGLLAIAPGAVASNYAAGKRSQYTPPIRLFLVVSFLFFLILSMTNTMIAAIDVAATKENTVEISTKEKGGDSVINDQENASGGDVSSPPVSDLDINLSGSLELGGEEVNFDTDDFDCELSVQPKFFVRPAELEHDAELWQRCATSIEGAVKKRIEEGDDTKNITVELEGVESQEAIGLIQQGLQGISNAIENPVAFNRALNSWLPRVMFLMTPILALILALFIRGRDALVFDHIVFALYIHAAMFSIVGIAILLGQASFPHMGLVAFLAIAVYFILGLKRTYRRGWLKTIWTALLGGALYSLILTSAVTAIVLNIVWTGG